LYKALMVLQLAVRSFSQSMGTRDWVMDVE
jgi:hypothetical protein